MFGPVSLNAPSDVLTALAGVGRTEDVAFSPDNRRLAIAGFTSDSIALLDLQLRFTPEPAVVLTGLTQLRSPGLAYPHGLVFLDDQLLAVANRKGAVVVLPLPMPAVGVESAVIEPVMVIGGNDTAIESPGSLAVVRLGPELCELLVCNNYVHHVTRHVVDTRTQRVVSGEVLLAAGLAIPDGIAVSNDHCWLAVSNHSTNSVLVFRNSADLGPSSHAVGELHGVAYPHGLRFTADDAHLIVAAAGAPHVVVFERGDDEWVGNRSPVATVRVMDDDTFQRGNANPEEGGPKGLDIDRTGRIMAITSEHDPIQFLALSVQADSGLEPDEMSMIEALRTALIRSLDRPQALELRTTQLERELTEQQARIRQLERTLTRTRNGLFQQVQLEQARLAATGTSPPLESNRAASGGPANA